MDEKMLSGILERIARIRRELDELEDQIKGAGIEASEPANETASEEPIDLSISVPDISSAHISKAEPIKVEESETKPEPEAKVEYEPKPEAEPEPKPEKEPEEEQKPEPETEPKPEIEPKPEQAEEAKSEPAKPETEEKKEPKKSKHKKPLVDSAVADTAVIDVMKEKEAWRTDIPGYPVKNIISAISLNDRVLLINSLFREDPVLFQDTIAKFNAMANFTEALEYVKANFPDWKMDSEPVYRLMMAVRRKLK